MMPLMKFGEFTINGCLWWLMTRRVTSLVLFLVGSAVRDPAYGDGTLTIEMWSVHQLG